jgi:chromate transporter
MKILLLYLLFSKAPLRRSVDSLPYPVLRTDFVLHHQLLTDQQLDTAVVLTRTTPGPVEVYIVSVEYLAGGIAGACAGWLAMITPAFLILPLLRFAGPMR